MATNTKIVENPISYNRSVKQEYETKFFWRNVIWYAFLHSAMLYGFYLMFTSARWKTSLFETALFLASCLGSVLTGTECRENVLLKRTVLHRLGAVNGAKTSISSSQTMDATSGCVLERVAFLGITAGAHRLWSHRSYKARWPLRVFLCILNTVAFQNDIYEWCRDHRVHHKFVETDADPHNIKRGFFFAHIGWLLCKKHPDVAKKGKAVYFEDLWADPIVKFQRRFYIPLALFFSFYLPTMIPVWCWGETVWNSFFIAAIARYCISLNITWLVNSAAHKFGNQPFDKYMEARENPLVALLTIGEGWHNYHHVFPWDYATSELGYTFNTTKVFIDAMAVIGLAYDLKTAKPNAIKDRKLKSGDGTRVTLYDKQKNI